VRDSEQAVALYRGLGAGTRLGNGLYTLGVVLTAVRRTEEALACLSDALILFRTARQTFWEAMTQHSMGEAHLASGDHRQAASYTEVALALLADIGGEWRRANALVLLGRALDAAGEKTRAAACWKDALAVHSALESTETEEVRALLDQDTACEMSDLPGRPAEAKQQG
jgi:tetratricopeptide (TPR) repeat protein